MTNKGNNDASRLIQVVSENNNVSVMFWYKASEFNQDTLSNGFIYRKLYSIIYGILNEVSSNSYTEISFVQLFWQALVTLKMLVDGEWKRKLCVFSTL